MSRLFISVCLLALTTCQPVYAASRVCEERHRRLDLEVARLQKRKDDPHE